MALVDGGALLASSRVASSRFDGLLEADERYFELHGAIGRWRSCGGFFSGAKALEKCGKSWENHGKCWENHGKTMGNSKKMKIIGGKEDMGDPLSYRGKPTVIIHLEMELWESGGFQRNGRFTTNGGLFRGKNPRWPSKNCGIDQ